MQGSFPSALAGLPSLKRLYLQNNQLRYTPITQISTLRNSFISCCLACIIQVSCNNSAPDAIVGGNLGVHILLSELGRVRSL